MPNKLPTEASVSKALTIYLEEPLPEVFVTDNDSYVSAGEALRSIKARQRELDDLRRTVTRPIDEAKRGIMQLFDPVLTRYSRRELMLKTAIKVYDQQVEVARRQEEARLLEARRVEEVEARAEANRLRSRGHEERAEAVLASVPPMPVAIADKPKLDGISSRRVWKAEVTDLDALIHWAASVGSSSYLQANIPELNTLARSLSGTSNIPGVRFYEEVNLAVRS